MATSKGSLNSEIIQYKNLMPILICLALAVLTIAAFWQIKDCGFINLDDNIFVFENAYVQSGLNWNSIGQAFSPSSALTEKGGWVPLAWLSLMLDYSIFGLNPAGFHLTNLLLHVLSTILLFLILRRMTRALWPSAFVAALFAIHPLHVESVAWIAERRDVLSTFFMMLTLGAYGYYVEQRNLKRYAFVLLFFILGLMAKPMLVTLPFALLLLDFWPLGRLSATRPDQKTQSEALKPAVSDRQKKKSKKKADAKEIPEVKKPVEPEKPAVAEYKCSLIYPLLWEKIPLFALAIVSSIATYIVAQSVGFIHSEAIPLDVRIGNALISYIAYMGKMIWPVHLAVLYPHPGGVILWHVMGALLLIIAITTAVFWMAKRSPYLATGWLWYLGTLVPVIGIVKLGAQAMADRYTYIPLIGLFIIVAWGVPDLLKKWNHRKEILLTLSALSIFCLSIMTWTQVGYWRDSITLYDHTLKVTDYNGIIYNNRGNAHNKLGNYGQAIEDCSRAIAIKPGYSDAYITRADAYYSLGNFKQAIEDYDRTIAIKPDYAMAYNNRGGAHIVLGNYRQAIEDFNRMIQIKPGYAEAYYNRGTAYNSLGNCQQAIADLSRAITIKPDYAMAYNNRGGAYIVLGNYRQAIEDFSRAIAIKPDFAGAYNNRGVAYVRSGKNNLAVNDLKAAAKLGDERAKNFLKSQGINW